MHSSRMCTTRLLTISQHALLGGIPAQRGVPAQGVCTCPGGGFCQEGGVPAQGVYLPQVLPPVNRMTDRCKNITLPLIAGSKNSKILKKYYVDKARKKNYGEILGLQNLGGILIPNGWAPIYCSAKFS